MDEAVYKEVTASIKAIFDLTARVDERVKILMTNQRQMDTKIESLAATQSDMSTKVGILEKVLETKGDGTNTADELKGLHNEIQGMNVRLHAVEKSATNSENKWKMIFDFVYKALWVILVCYLLFKLNLASPPLP